MAKNVFFLLSILYGVFVAVYIIMHVSIVCAFIKYFMKTIYIYIYMKG